LKDQWFGSNVDLNLLSQRVEQFFKESPFETRMEQIQGKFKIEASGFQFKITVNIFGQPNDFAVEFIPSKKTKGFSRSMVVAYITTLFGGGGFLLRDLKLQEALDELEKAFWENVDKQVSELTNSA
jgi:hypothetical protein